MIIFVSGHNLLSISLFWLALSPLARRLFHPMAHEDTILDSNQFEDNLHLCLGRNAYRPPSAPWPFRSISELSLLAARYPGLMLHKLAAKVYLGLMTTTPGRKKIPDIVHHRQRSDNFSLRFILHTLEEPPIKISSSSLMRRSPTRERRRVRRGRRPRR